MNPFTVGNPAPPGRFVGRRSQVATAFDQILNRSNMSIWGDPGIGKTSFLGMLASPQIWQLEGHDPSQAIVVFVNCLTLDPFTGLGFWQSVLSQAQAKLESLPDLQAAIAEELQEEKPVLEHMRFLLRQLGAQGKFLVLLADDYDVAFRTNAQYTEADIEAFLGQCRSIAYFSEERQYLSIIVTSSRRLNELGPKLTANRSPWYNHYLFRSLKPLEDSEVDSLLAGIPTTPLLRDGIREIADGHPALLQNAGYLIYEAWREGKLPELNAFARDFQSATLHYFEAAWDLSAEIEQTLLMLLALVRLEGRLQTKRYDLRDVEIVFSQREIELNSLVGRGVLKYLPQAEPACYAFASSVMEWWVVKKLQNSDEAELQQREKMFLNLMSHKQLEKFKATVRWIWGHREEVPAVLEYIGKVASAFPKGMLPG